jgi:phenylpropionate dioxygenase-like ring-hydroxylating dioxygenase large terminal subunit
MSEITLEFITGKIDEQLARDQYPADFPALPPVPTGRYSDSGFAELERAQIWGKTWLLACLTSELPEPGSYVLFERCGVSVIISRGKDGLVRAFHNVCRHRASALLKAPKGRTMHFICPYHSWGYALDGTLKSVPEAHNFKCLSKADRGLVPVRCETWRGIIFVNLDENAPPLAEFMAPLSAQTSGFPLEELVVHQHYTAELDCNWKLALHNFLEGYHTNAVHPKTLAPYLMPRSLSASLLDHGHARIAVKKAKGASIYTSDDRSSDPVAEVFKRYAISIACFPNNFFALDPNGFALQSFWPIGVNKSILDIRLVGLKSAPSDQEYWGAMRKVIDGILAEDLSLFSGIQNGVQSGAAADILMGYQERTPYWLEEEIDRRIGHGRLPPELSIQQVLQSQVEK